MGAKATIWAWRNAPRIDQKKPMVLLTFLAIADIANDRTGKLWASQAYIAEKGHLSPRSVRSSIPILEGLGLIRTEAKFGAVDVIWLNLTATTIYEDGPEPDEEITAQTARGSRKPRHDARGDRGTEEVQTAAPTAAGGADKPREPREGNQAPNGASSARGSRLPEGWEPEPNIATLIGLTVDEAADQLARFHDYWTAQPGAKGRKADWTATWRNWCRTAMERRNGRGSPASYGSAGRVDPALARAETYQQALESGARQAVAAGSRRRRWGFRPD